MMLAVWMLYAVDRLLDARMSRDGLEARHYFHDRHRRGFFAAIFVDAALLALLLPRMDARELRLYCVLGTFLAGYFLLVHLMHQAPRHSAKEMAVGIFFAGATFVPAIARRPELAGRLCAEALVFAVLCWLNCLFIYKWEHPGLLDRGGTRFVVRHLALFAALLVVAALGIAVWCGGLVLLACAASGALLIVLDRRRQAFSAVTLRAMADLALMTPLLFLPLAVR